VGFAIRVPRYATPMRFFKLRYALLGWLVAKLARRRLTRRLNALAGNRRARQIKI
jgi:hypothetical protein